MDPIDRELPPQAYSALAAASAVINSTLDYQEALESIAKLAASVLHADASSVLTYDKRRNKLIFAAAFGKHGITLLGKEFDAERGIAGRVLKSREAINIEDATETPYFFGGIDAQTHFHTRGVVAAPMIYKTEPIGVIEVLNRSDGKPFDWIDTTLLNVFANLAAAGARNARTHESLRKENRVLRDTLMAGTAIIGTSQPLRQVLDLADRVASTNASVLVLGETGTGKELLAKYVHMSSPRRDKPFVAVNCAALTETLLESELFGHEKGAFTGAVAQHTGRFELADEGTLFLDEIGDISPSTQVRLLRLLQEKAFTRVGGTKTIYCDVRVIAATHRDLKKAISAGTFREDLFYRLNVFPIPLPPLRERWGDIPSLADHFARTASVNLGLTPRTISQEVQTALMEYPWPGNIRELANVIERAVLMCDGAELLCTHLPAEITSGGGLAPASANTATGLWDNERAMIIKALEDNRWNQSKAARALNISRDNLRYRVRKYNIERP